MWPGYTREELLTCKDERLHALVQKILDACRGEPLSLAFEALDFAKNIINDDAICKNPH